MRIRISNDWWRHYVREQPGRTNSEKEAHAEHAAHLSSPARPWFDGMHAAKGQWLEVETDFLFEDQFNVAEPNLRVMAKHIDGIDFGPEFESLDAYQQAVQRRYDKDWPGRKVECWILRHYIKQGLIEDATANKTEA